jgi:hypothetical protein
MGNHSSRKTPKEVVVAVCVLGATTAYLLAQAQRRVDICAALFQFEKKYLIYATESFRSVISISDQGSLEFASLGCS